MKQFSSLSEYRDVCSGSDSSLVFFKHSEICPISLGAYASLAESSYANSIYMISVQAQRDISDAIALDYGVKHESPQLIVVRDGIAIFDASHGEVVVEALESYLG